MPVHLSHIQDHAGQIGVLVKRARLSKGISLREFARATGISAAQLSNLETGKRGTDLPQLLTIARELAVPLGALLPSSCVRHFYISRRGDIFQQTPPMVPRVKNGHSPPLLYHNAFWPLAEPYSDKRMEPFIGRVEPLQDKDLSLVSSEPHMFAMVLKGTMEFRVQTGAQLHVERLQPGDCVYFVSHVPHISRALGERPAEVICVISSDVNSPRLTTELAVARSGGSYPLTRVATSEDPTIEVGQRIAYLREAYGVAIAELARAVGLTARQLAAVETGKRPVRMDTLYRLARTFQRPVSYFLPLEHDVHPAYAVCTAKEVVQAGSWRRSDGSQPEAAYFPLVTNDVARSIHPYLVRYSPGTPESRCVFPGQQFLYVLSGEIEFVFCEQNHTAIELLRPGDSVYFQTSFPHQIRAINKSPYATHAAEAITVFWSAIGNPGLGPE